MKLNYIFKGPVDEIKLRILKELQIKLKYVFKGIVDEIKLRI